MQSFFNNHRLLVIRLAITALAVVLITAILWAFSSLGFGHSVLVALIIAALLWLVPRFCSFLQSRRPRGHAESGQKPPTQSVSEEHSDPDEADETIEIPVAQTAADEENAEDSVDPSLSRRQRRKLEKARQKHEHIQSLLATVQPSEFMIEHSHLGPKELETTTYDEPHHWIVFWLLFMNPFWGRDNNPSKQSARAEDHEGSIDMWIVRLLRTVPFIGKWSTVLFVVVGLPMAWLTTQHHNWMHHVARFLRKVGVSHTLVSVITSGVFWVFIDLVFCGCLVVWGLYIRKLWKQDRLIMTDYSLGSIQEQLPWRPYSRNIIPIHIFTDYDPVQTVMARWFNFTHIEISNPGKDEPILVWEYARNPEKLMAILDRQRVRNQPGRNDDEAVEQAGEDASQAPKPPASDKHKEWEMSRSRPHR